MEQLYPSLPPLAVEDRLYHLIDCALGPKSLHAKQDHYPFSRFCTAQAHYKLFQIKMAHDSKAADCFDASVRL